MSNYNFTPKGRKSLPSELMQFGRHLVYSEGTRTEPFYVKNIKDRIAKKYKCKPNDIELIVATKDKSFNTTGLVSFAINDTAERLSHGEKIDHVWIMFDKDDFPNFGKAHEKINLMNNSDEFNADGFTYDKSTSIAWHSCWSNECFELWLCLYFSFYTSANNRTDYIKHLDNIPQLKKINFQYSKNKENIHDVLEDNGGSIDKAIKYAKRLESSNGIGNPSTGVYLFVEYFKNYMG